MSYVVQIVNPPQENVSFVILAYINKVDLTQCSRLSIHSYQTLSIVSQVFNAAAWVTMQHSI